MRLRGQIDRIDWDPARSRLAIRDYKSGKSKSLGALQTEVAQGRHLQVRLYAEALDALIDARLLTSYEASAGDDDETTTQRVEIIHESLLSNWPRLVRWQTQDQDGALLREISHDLLLPRYSAILIDEARTPLIISGDATDSTEAFGIANELVVDGGEGELAVLREDEALQMVDLGAERRLGLRTRAIPSAQRALVTEWLFSICFFP